MMGALARVVVVGSDMKLTNFWMGLMAHMELSGMDEE